MSATTRTTSCGHIDCLGLASCGQAGLLREDRYMAGYRDGKDYWRPIVAEAIKDLREGADEVVLDGLLAAYARAYPERDALAVAQVPEPIRGLTLTASARVRLGEGETTFDSETVRELLATIDNMAALPAQEERPELLTATDPRQVSSSAQEERLDGSDRQPAIDPIHWSSAVDTSEMKRAEPYGTDADGVSERVP